MHSIQSELLLYIRQNFSRKTTLYSSCPKVFETIRPKKTNYQKPPLQTTPLSKPKTKSPPPENQSIANSSSLKESKKEVFSVEPMKQEKKSPSADLHAFYQKMAPELLLTTPSLGEVWILIDEMDRPFGQTLDKMKVAISAKYRPCKMIDVSLIEQNQDWEAFFFKAPIHLVVVIDTLMVRSCHLSRYLKSHSIPYLVLENFAKNLETPETKKVMWETLTQRIKP